MENVNISVAKQHKMLQSVAINYKYKIPCTNIEASISGICGVLQLQHEITNERRSRI